MSELYSKAEDCNKLANILYSKLKRKIDFYGSTYQEVVSGKYYCLPFEDYESYADYRKDALLFSYKYCENGFLRISIGDVIDRKSVGHKLAALSDFCGVLSEIYGTPTLFYTIKDDDKKTLNLQWSFSQKEEDIEEFKNGTAFDDAELDELIVFGETKKRDDSTSEKLASKIGLPSELLYLVDINLEDFFKYKYGKTIIVCNETEVNPKPTISSAILDNEIESNEKALRLYLETQK